MYELTVHNTRGNTMHLTGTLYDTLPDAIAACDEMLGRAQSDDHGNYTVTPDEASISQWDDENFYARWIVAETRTKRPRTWIVAIHPHMA